MTRTCRQLLLGCLLAAVLPLATYEFFQKGSENLGLHRGPWSLSQRAEESVRWNPPTGWRAFDHALHEWQEAGRFYALAASILRSQG